MAKLIKGMKLLYSPSGRAGEYADHGFAANLYNGCVHGCDYCYVPACKRMLPSTFHASVTPQKDVLNRLAHDVDPVFLAKQGIVINEPIFLCFSCDPYPPGEINGLTREAIRIIMDSDHRVNILTKGGMRVGRDLDLLASKPGNKLGATLTFTKEADSSIWEPGAALPDDRIEMLRQAHARGIYTWVSMEPVIDPEQTLALIHIVAPFVNQLRIGKWNHDRRADDIDWKKFHHDAKTALEMYGAQYILKQDLIEAAGEVR